MSGDSDRQLPTVVLVTDPMCSWCWGMAPDFKDVLAEFAGQIHFDLMLGGINPTSTQPIGDYGRRFLNRLWQDVTATTQVKFGQLPEQDYVHNSTAPCLVLQAAREVSGTVPFDLLYKMQEAFCLHGVAISDQAHALQVAADHGFDKDELDGLMVSTKVREQLKFQFANARSFGTDALPSLIWKNADNENFRLLAGGYVNADMFAELVKPIL